MRMARFMGMCLFMLVFASALSAQPNDPAYTEALRRTRSCAAHHDTSLDLSSLGLTEVPPEIWQFAVLQRLYLSQNQLTTLPPEIGRLANLQVLNLYSNQLTSVPPEIGQLTNLQVLDLEFNQLTRVPPEIGQLAALQVLIWTATT